MYFVNAKTMNLVDYTKPVFYINLVRTTSLRIETCGTYIADNVKLLNYYRNHRLRVGTAVYVNHFVSMKFQFEYITIFI